MRGKKARYDAEGIRTLECRQAGRNGPHSASGAVLAGMSERVLAEHVRQTLTNLPGVLAYHTHDSRHSAPGFPDWIVLAGERAWALELKSATGSVEPEQHEWLAAFGRMPGWTAQVVRPANWPAVRDEIVEAAIGGER